MENMLHNLKTKEKFNELLRKIDYLIKVIIFIAVKFLEFGYKSVGLFET